MTKQLLIKASLTLITLWLIIIGPLYAVAILTGLPGMRGGPQDAFRHTFASALVSHFISPNVVNLVTEICESDSNSKMDLMDRHNNRIGKLIGEKQISLREIYSEVLTSVNSGRPENSDENQITWLTADHWSLGI